MSGRSVDLGDLRRVLRESAGVSAGVDIDGDIMDTEFADLGYDSVSMLEVTARIGREYGLSIDDDGLADATTPRRLLHLVNSGR